MFKINLHAHTRYSDGEDSIIDMAVKCRQLGYTACVITDHVYPTNMGSEYSLDIKSYEAEVREAREVSHKLDYPVIVGIELLIGWEEILVFGSTAIAHILQIRNRRHIESGFGRITVDDILDLKTHAEFATVLCHPELSINEESIKWYEKLSTLVDGFEVYNSGKFIFNNMEVPEFLKTKKHLSGADAHASRYLKRGYNEFSENITTEEHLIKYLNKPHTTSLAWAERVPCN